MSRDGRSGIITLALLAASSLIYVRPLAADAAPDRQTPLAKRIAAVREAALRDRKSDRRARMRAALAAAAEKRGVELAPDALGEPAQIAQWFNWFNWNNWNNWNNWGNWFNWPNWGNWVNM